MKDKELKIVFGALIEQTSDFWVLGLVFFQSDLNNKVFCALRR